MSTWLVDKLSGLMDARTDRRGFFGKSAMVGTAVVVAPTTFVLKPGSAYAAICNCNGSLCNCGDLCCDGYTEFCCTIYGKNRCPEGTLVGGWWKADGSSFCVGQPRYYVDCNTACSSACPPDSSGFCSGACFGCSCGCAQGSCGNRKACCTRFRYGQCNQGVPSMGPIVCRVITCTPPWVWETTCTTTSATDNNTAFHNRPCLQASDPTDPVGPPPKTPLTAAQKAVVLAPEDDMKLLKRPGNNNTWYLLYPSGLLIDVSGNSNDVALGGIERMGEIKPQIFNRIVIVNEHVREALGMNPKNISRI